MMDLRGTISLPHVVNTADTLQQGEEPQYCSTIPHLSPLLGNIGERQ